MLYAVVGRCETLTATSPMSLKLPSLRLMELIALRVSHLTRCLTTGPAHRRAPTLHLHTIGHCIIMFTRARRRQLACAASRMPTRHACAGNQEVDPKQMRQRLEELRKNTEKLRKQGILHDEL